jgi:long-chain acyl-CoA synthetase
MFEGRKTQFIETQVKYEDGRTGKVSADLRIEEVKTFAPQAGKRAA